MECLPFPSKINSLDWSSFPELAEGVGEVYGSPRAYNGAKAIPYAHGLTPCEPPAVFAEGDTYDPLRPPQKYDEKGFPLCCLDRFVSTGGLLWGGTAVVNVVPGNYVAGTPCSNSTLLPFPATVTIETGIATPGRCYYDVTSSSTVKFVSSSEGPVDFIQIYTLNAAGLLPGDGCFPGFEGTIGPTQQLTVPHYYPTTRVVILVTASGSHVIDRVVQLS